VRRPRLVAGRAVQATRISTGAIKVAENVTVETIVALLSKLAGA